MRRMCFRSRTGELARAAIAAGTALAALAATAWISHRMLPGFAGPVLATSMGAAAVLMFAAPDSPLATHRAFLGGNLVSAVIGVSVYLVAGPSPESGALAVALAIFTMHLLRCQHPPGGATALLAVIGGPAVHHLGYGYVLAPIGLNLLIFEGFVALHRRWLGRLVSNQK